ncbi:basic proline-rich protein-like [Mustela erminea]|uniref:basic proline-rich protein-like n=1 Tax=Mustela erminea TaxID=36723 RepID=UPI0013872A0C|nr:basic proline-rich protein-like [Mustela erminea]
MAAASAPPLRRRPRLFPPRRRPSARAPGPAPPPRSPRSPRSPRGPARASGRRRRLPARRSPARSAAPPPAGAPAPSPAPARRPSARSQPPPPRGPRPGPAARPPSPPTAPAPPRPGVPAAPPPPPAPPRDPPPPAPGVPSAPPPSPRDSPPCPLLPGVPVPPPRSPDGPSPRGSPVPAPPPPPPPWAESRGAVGASARFLARRPWPPPWAAFVLRRRLALPAAPGHLRGGRPQPPARAAGARLARGTLPRAAAGRGEPGRQPGVGGTLRTLRGRLCGPRGAEVPGDGRWSRGDTRGEFSLGWTDRFLGLTWASAGRPEHGGTEPSRDTADRRDDKGTQTCGADPAADTSWSESGLLPDSGPRTDFSAVLLPLGERTWERCHRSGSRFLTLSGSAQKCTRAGRSQSPPNLNSARTHSPGPAEKNGLSPPRKIICFPPNSLTAQGRTQIPWGELSMKYACPPGLKEWVLRKVGV